MNIILAEAIGCCMFILLTNATMIRIKKFNNNIGSKMFATFSFAAVWTFISYIFGTTSGAHFSPSISLALAIDGSLKSELLLYYIISQIVGAIIGATISVLIYANELKDVTAEDLIEAVSNNPKKENIIIYAIKELLIAFLLMFGIKAVGMIWGMVGGLNYFYLFIIIMVLGFTIADFSSYAVNPIRDIPCKVVILIYSIITKKDVKIDWVYSIIALITMFIGSIAAVYTYYYFPWPILK